MQQQRRNYRQVPNFNFIPAEYQRPTFSFRRLALRLLLVVVIVSEGLVIQNLYQQKSTFEATIDSSQQRIRQIEEKLAIVQAEEALKQEHQTLESEWQGLTLNQANWPQIMVAFLHSKPQGLVLSSLTQDGEQLNATGTASDYATLLEYRRTLLASPAISRIISLDSRKTEGSISFSLSAIIKMGGK